MKTHDFRLDGRVALVTGATRGLGRAMAFALARAGAAVAISWRNSPETAQATLAEFNAEGLRGMLVRADVTDQSEVRRMVSEINAALGPVDIAVYNATCGHPQKPIEEYDWEFHRLLLDYFLKSPYLITREVLPHMKTARRGRIICITSEVFRRGSAPFSAYVAAKGAQTGWSRSMAAELAPFGITVNMVAPGWIPVERHQADPPEAKEAYRRAIPMGHFGVPADVAGAVAFLASDAAGFITGADLPVNGGTTIG